MGPTTRPGAKPRVATTSVHSCTVVPVPSPAEAAAFHPRPQQFVAPPAPPPLWFGPQHFAFDPAAPQHFALDPAAHHQQFAAQFAFDPAAAMGRGSAGYNYNLNLNLNLPATRPENQRFTGSAFPSTHWPVRTPAAASASSGSGPPPAP